MSDYVKEKVLRIPVNKTNLIQILKERVPTEYEYDDLHALGSAFPRLCSHGTEGKFQISPTYEGYIDYVLEYEYGVCCGDYGKVRTLRKSEQDRYAPRFHEIDPSIDMNDVHLVEFCYYNACEADDYYEITDDPFNDEV